MMKYEIGFNKKLKDSSAWQLSEKGQRELIEAGFAEYEDMNDHSVIYFMDNDKPFALLCFVIVFNKLFISLCYVEFLYRRKDIFVYKLYKIIKSICDNLGIKKIYFFVHQENKIMKKLALYMGFKPSLILYSKEV